jgi:hypothetical protein
LSFFSHIGCRLCKCSVLPCRWQSVPTSHTTRPNFTKWAHEIFSVCHPPFPFYDLEALVGHGLLIFEVSRSHSDTSHSVGILWTSPSQRRLSDNTQNSQETAITASGGHKPAILASKRQQTHRLDRTANGIAWFSSQLSYFAILRQWHDL